MWVNDVDYIWNARHIFDTTQEFFKTCTLFVKKCNFFLRKNFESSISFHLFDFFQTSDTFLDSIPVCKSTTQPTVVDVVLTSTSCFFSYCFSCLFFSTNEQDYCIVSCCFTNEFVSCISHFYSLLQVDNVDSVTFCEDVLSHLRIPATSLVTEVNTSLKKLFH